MKIFITGATGLIGTELVSKLLMQTCEITALVRNLDKARCQLPTAVKLVNSLSDYVNFDEFDVVINLVGEPIFDRRWTIAQKQQLIQSRVEITRKLTELINQSHNPPHTFISGSATGYYGDCGEELIDENMPAGESFSAKLCQRWEAAALNAQTRVCVIRTGMVIAVSGGIMRKILPLYRYGLGGKLGNGQQYWAWIHLQDMVNGLIFLLNYSTCQGVFNFVAPHSIKNAEFNRTLGQLLHRPAFMSVPTLILRLLFGERAELILDSQKIFPRQLINAGFYFQYPTIKLALRQIVTYLKNSV